MTRLAPVLLLTLPLASAADLLVAAASDLAPLGPALEAEFARSTGHRVRFTYASSGSLARQIENGAPFDVFLSADAERPALLERKGLAVQGSRFTYALGRLVLWSADPERVDAAGAVLEAQDWRHLAIANPALAPYGAAAREVLTRRGLWERVETRIVRGEDVAQAYHFVATGNAELGFVALAQLAGKSSGSRWLVPEDLHAPLEQQAVLLERARDNAAAEAFLEFLRRGTARAVIEAAGYRLPTAP
jgi:molybdate transport system substrate-binding protein